MPTELEFYRVKLAIAKGIFGYKAVPVEQFDKCHIAALNVFQVIGTPAYLFDDEFMGRKLYFTYVDYLSDITGRYQHEIRTAIDMLITGFCNELWCGPTLGLVRGHSYTLLDGTVKLETLDEQDAIEMFVDKIGERYEHLSRAG